MGSDVLRGGSHAPINHDIRGGRNDNNATTTTTSREEVSRRRSRSRSHGRGDRKSLLGCRNENHPDDTLVDSSEGQMGTGTTEGEMTESHDVIPELEEDYDFDADYDEEDDEDDLVNFDYDHLTKPEHLEMDGNQRLYLAACQKNAVLPVAYILRNLQCGELRLHSMCLGMTRIKMLAVALATNVNVRVLEISSDVIDSQAMIHLVEAFKENEMVEQLYLQDNNMGRSPVRVLLEYLSRADHVTHLSLSGNSLGDDAGPMVEVYVQNSSNLTTLDLSCNSLGMASGDALGRAFSRNSSVHTLSLRWNHWTDKATDAFLRCLTRNRSIATLDISWNGMGHASVGSLLAAIRSNTSLTTLDISACGINGPDLQEIGGALKKNTALKNLILGNNLLCCEAVSEFVLDLQKHKGPLGVKEIDFEETPIHEETKHNATKLMIERELMVLHGPVLGRLELHETDEEALLHFNPAIVLTEFGRIQGMDLTTLFEYMDDDGSGSISRDEIKEGLKKFNIPLPELSVDLLIRQLDRDGDGALSLTELLVYDPRSTKARLQEQLYSKEKQYSQSGVQIGNTRCRKILRRMMLEQQRRSTKILHNKNSEARKSNNDNGDDYDDDDDDGNNVNLEKTSVSTAAPSRNRRSDKNYSNKAVSTTTEEVVVVGMTKNYNSNKLAVRTKETDRNSSVVKNSSREYERNRKNGIKNNSISERNRNNGIKNSIGEYERNCKNGIKNSSSERNRNNGDIKNNSINGSSAPDCKQERYRHYYGNNNNITIAKAQTTTTRDATAAEKRLGRKFATTKDIKEDFKNSSSGGKLKLTAAAHEVGNDNSSKTKTCSSRLTPPTVSNGTSANSISFGSSTVVHFAPKEKQGVGATTTLMCSKTVAEENNKNKCARNYTNSGKLLVSKKNELSIANASHRISASNSKEKETNKDNTFFYRSATPPPPQQNEASTTVSGKTRLEKQKEAAIHRRRDRMSSKDKTRVKGFRDSQNSSAVQTGECFTKLPSIHDKN